MWRGSLLPLECAALPNAAPCFFRYTSVARSGAAEQPRGSKLPRHSKRPRHKTLHLRGDVFTNPQHRFFPDQHVKA
ncbi:hypothetical protein C1X89_07385 [Pseudomonas sp. GP01-A8]|nr:hypothetical protein C1X90_23010 [Pseudomonas sp. GP01-A9]PMU31057.1 hypothetical protein C1X88_07215 [Pseudomonas sp. GP01-A13]PMU42969.1 hypothetical protein C1X89_07385 [Pseudomonas sp. GP01-A8]PMU54962.1 hypothetical protein C1X87_05140 [Pseudomonas sp. GP01-A14]PMU57768.1 hypothetical protein C1X85_02535 [Pseudomonas sp. GP01-A6]PMU62155.1 hypothetical protein C1X86_14265 [Pseudomonas sp. GP01-A3]PMU77425.1 hypothetical protein C1X81_06360 [Pseudomonas sp. FW215-L2]PMU77714.1 hypothe